MARHAWLNSIFLAASLPPICVRHRTLDCACCLGASNANNTENQTRADAQGPGLPLHVTQHAAATETKGEQGVRLHARAVYGQPPYRQAAATRTAKTNCRHSALWPGVKELACRARCKRYAKHLLNVWAALLYSLFPNLVLLRGCNLCLQIIAEMWAEDLGNIGFLRRRHGASGSLASSGLGFLKATRGKGKRFNAKRRNAGRGKANNVKRNNAMQCNAMRCETMRCGAAQNNAQQSQANECNAKQGKLCKAKQSNGKQSKQCNPMQRKAMQSKTTQSKAMQLMRHKMCKSQQSNKQGKAMHCKANKAMQCNAMQSNALKCSSTQVKAKPCNAIHRKATIRYTAKQHNAR